MEQYLTLSILETRWLPTSPQKLCAAGYAKDWCRPSDTDRARITALMHAETPQGGSEPDSD